MKIFDTTIVASNIFNPMKPKKLPYKKFLESFKYAPRPAVNLLIEHAVNQGLTFAYAKVRPLETKEILLTKRKKPPFAGSWHLPGSFVLKGEALMDCVDRVAGEELGIKVKNIELAGAFDDIEGDPRGHVIDLVYRCRAPKGATLITSTLRRRVGPLRPVGDTVEIRFFQKLPAKIGFNHRDTLEKLGYK